MIAIEIRAVIDAPIEEVFDRLAHLPGYSSWLAGAGVFRDCRMLSEPPVRAGTTYLDRTRLGTFRGRVLELRRPHRVVFEQELHWAGVPIFRARQGNALESSGGMTTLRHDFEGWPSAVARVGEPVVARIVRAERERVIAALSASCRARSATA